MRFEETKLKLIELFDDIKVKEWISKKEYHKERIMVEKLSNGTKIYISFIGYKTQIKNGNIVYDYRVDLEKDDLSTSLSHNNIVLDIYNKVLNGKMNHKVFLKYLVKSSTNRDFNLNEVEKNCKYNSTDPNKDLIDFFDSTHKKLNKSFNKKGNKYDLTFEELFTSILYISVQEDINYPIKKNYEGRKMCFTRYIETLYLFENNNKKLEDIIKRSLSHYRPTLWEELNYSFLKNIKLFVW